MIVSLIITRAMVDDGSDVIRNSNTGVIIPGSLPYNTTLVFDDANDI